jgi:hypothetical protein
MGSCEKRNDVCVKLNALYDIARKTPFQTRLSSIITSMFTTEKASGRRLSAWEKGWGFLI